MHTADHLLLPSACLSGWVAGGRGRVVTGLYGCQLWFGSSSFTLVVVVRSQEDLLSHVACCRARCIAWCWSGSSLQSCAGGIAGWNGSWLMVLLETCLSVWLCPGLWLQAWCRAGGAQAGCVWPL